EENLLSMAYSASSTTDDVANVYDLRDELHVDGDEDRMTYYCTSSSKAYVHHARGDGEASVAVHKLAQTDMFRSVDSAASVVHCRQGFSYN
ncbi:hypothetical protein DYB37_012548, partial [Aphanomyces astaci]